MIDERPSSQRRLAPASRAVAALTAVAVTLASVPVRAQEGGLPVIRDAETEQLLSDYTAPILRAAGLSHQNIHPVIINDRAFNAFVMDAKHIFVNAGALVDSKTPNQIIGVLAHETGHIAGGHLLKTAHRTCQRPDRRDPRHVARRRRRGGRRTRRRRDW